MSPYAYNSSNELTSTPSATFTYDGNGNTLTKVDSSGTTRYNWDFENRLASVVLPGTGGTATFKYDPFGRRIQKNSSSATTNYLYDGVNSTQEIDATGTLLASYTQGESTDEPLAALRNGTSGYYEQDALGSVASISGTAATLLNSDTYDSFGNLETSTDSFGNPFHYTGRDSDSETGLRYYRARYYSPETGRFISEDPRRFFQGPSFYSYVTNNPLNFTDSSGLQATRPQNLPLGTQQQYWGPFSTGFAQALNRLNSVPGCAELFEPTCHGGPQTTGANQMSQTEYRFAPLPQGSGAGAQTVDPTHVQINSAGIYMTGARGNVIKLPDGSLYDLGSQANIEAFILLHELGHQLPGNTGFTADVDGPTNTKHSLLILKLCFPFIFDIHMRAVSAGRL